MPEPLQITDSACLSEDELLRFTMGLGEAGDAERVERHVDGCEECRELLAETLRALPPPPPGHPASDGDGPHVEPFDRLPGGRLAPGTSVGRYLIEAPLGAGGMGVVYVARDPQLRRQVALKLLRGDRLGERPTPTELAHRQSRLLREAQAMARLRHPNVVVVHDVGPYDDGLFVAMELIEGRNVREWVARERPSWRQVLPVLRAAGEGLCAAHTAGIIHRDFKPDNVLLGAGGRVCVTDFGIAATEPRGATLAGAPTALTSTGMVLGTPGYMAPEQLMGLPVDERADVYAFCVTLYEALLGRLPGATADAAAAPEPRVPAWLRRAVLAGLQPEAAARPASMRALLDRLDERRHARRRLILIATPLLALGAVAAVALPRLGAHPAPGPCDDTSERLGGVWDGARREEVRRAFLATGRPHGADLAVATARVLDGYAARWEAEHRRSCEATWVQRSQSEEVFAAQARCLGSELEQLGALVGRLARADVATMEGAITAAHALEAPARCTSAAPSNVAGPATVAAPSTVAVPSTVPAQTGVAAQTPVAIPAPAPAPPPAATPAPSTSTPTAPGRETSRKKSGARTVAPPVAPSEDALKKFDL